MMKNIDLSQAFIQRIFTYAQRYMNVHKAMFGNAVKYLCANPCIHSHRKPPKREMENNYLVPLNQTLQSQKVTDTDINTYGWSLLSVQVLIKSLSGALPN